MGPLLSSLIEIAVRINTGESISMAREEKITSKALFQKGILKWSIFFLAVFSENRMSARSLINSILLCISVMDAVLFSVS